jgi:CheY-like chemotaxis protein
MCRVLIVDDNEDHREIAREALAMNGHEAIEAENGRVALEWLRKYPKQLPCIALVDLAMPVMDGWDFLDAVRREPTWAAMTVIVFSARVRKNEPPPVLRASGYWPKPPSVDQLQDIERWCQRHAGRAANH